jgi:serine/threonine protein phosphatase PrpC
MFKPDVRTIKLEEDKDDFLVIACDGIWNSMTSQQVCDFIAERINNMSLKDITSEVSIIKFHIILM